VYIINKLILAAVLLILPIGIIAQSLPTKQQISLYAPRDIKIDGKSLEWPAGLQAYNHATNLFYTIANDDTNLYLIFKATDKDIIDKIIRGGILLTIKQSNKKKDINAVSITFPLFDRHDAPNINLMAKPDLTKDTLINRKRIDSFTYVLNKELLNRLKFIKVVGVTRLPDSLISIYNEYGIKALAQFDARLAYTYELAFPLKDLPKSILTEKMFSYNVKINGLKAYNLSREIKSGLTNVDVVNGEFILHGPSADKGMAMMSSTDFSSEYKLAEK
jgi:hypothetical protein